MFSTLLNKLGNVMTELQHPGYNYCGPFTKLDKRLGKRYESVTKFDSGFKKNDIFNSDY